MEKQKLRILFLCDEVLLFLSVKNCLLDYDVLPVCNTTQMKAISETASFDIILLKSGTTNFFMDSKDFLENYQTANQFSQVIVLNTFLQSENWHAGIRVDYFLSLPFHCEDLVQLISLCSDEVKTQNLAIHSTFE